MFYIDFYMPITSLYEVCIRSNSNKFT